MPEPTVAPPPAAPPRRGPALSRFRVPLGYAFGLVVLFLAAPSRTSTLVGLSLALFGEAVRLWASGHIQKTQTLATGGPYAHTQNPLYVGSVLMALGVVVAAASPWVGLAVVVYFAFFYPRVIREEAAFLAAKFPGEHAEWVRHVPRFFPRLLPGGPAASRFEWARVAANREWRTCAALPLVFALLHLRGWLR